MNSFKIKRHDAGPPLRLFVMQSDEASFNFTGYTQPRFIMRALDAATPKVSAAAAIDDAQGGVLRYDWVPADTDTAGRYQAEFELIDPAGKKRTFPVDEYAYVEVIEDLNNA